MCIKSFLLCSFILVIPLMAKAQNGLQILPIDSDQCSIFHALTGQTMAGCVKDFSQDQITRSVTGQEENGYVIQFDFDSKALKQAEQEHLFRLSNLLAGPLAHLCLKLVGHTDTRGSAAYNQRLSERRAQSVRLFLVGPGQLGTNRVLSEGVGETHPISGLPGADGQNRRVEILGKDTRTGQCT